MNQINEHVMAIDIGTTKIVAIVGKRNTDGKIEILGMGKAPSNGVKRGVIMNIDETANAIQVAVNQAQTASGFKFSDVYVGIAGQHIRSIKNRGYKFIETKDLEIKQTDVDDVTAQMFRLHIDPGEEIIHVIPQDYIVDNENGIIHPVGMTGKKLDGNFHIVIGQTASAKNIEKCITRLGLKVNKLILEPIASAEAVLTEDEKEAGVALVDIGGGTTDIAIYCDNVIRHTGVIPFGGNVITKDIRTGCSILQRHAEALKVQYGSALGDIAPENKVVTIPGISGRDSKEISFKSLAYIIQARMEEIIDQVMFEIENSGFASDLRAGIALTGGGAMLKHLPQLVKYRTGLDVRLAYPGEFVTPGTSEKISLPMYSTSVGLIMKGLEHKEHTGQGAQNNAHAQDETSESPYFEGIKNKGKNLISRVSGKLLSMFDETDHSM